ncbi:MAG TPA: hypothetical protein VMB79_06290, partial [Jatrophihabitans sp.]|nr:hypothetical protein [Jatrophihabitans sp.]
MTTVLTLNPGSSSLKASVREPAVRLVVTVERIGTGAGRLTVAGRSRPFAGGPGQAVAAVAAELGRHGMAVDAVAHRVVHGGPAHRRPAVIDDALLADLRAAVPLAPLHLPGALDAIERARRAWPAAVQLACFDTAFHAGWPAAAGRLPVAAELAAAGVRRYG